VSGRELDADGTDAYHPQHPWEQAGHPLYLPPEQRAKTNWPPEPARPSGPAEASRWSALPVRPPHQPAWDRVYLPLHGSADARCVCCDGVVVIRPGEWRHRSLWRTLTCGRPVLTR
jgi:hypothetical protein